MDLHISLIGRHDLAGEIYRQLRAAILDGRIRGGEALPPSRELARRLSVSRSTVTVAYDRLISEAFATPRVGSGTFVTGHAAAGRRGARRPGGGLRPRPAWQGIPVPTHLGRGAEFDFRAGSSDTDHFPYGTWRRLMAGQFRPSAVGPGGYGDPAGHAGLREAIARHVAVSRGVRASADDVVITGGTQQAVDLIARVLLAPGDVVAVEDPGYSPPRRLLIAQGLKVIGVPVDHEGLVVGAIPDGTKVVCVGPSHQFPLGVAMSLSRRFALLDWARRHDAAIVEDDYDSEFRFGGRPIEPLQLLDGGGRVIYVGSFSKTTLPALRLGFIITPVSLRAALHGARYLTDWHSPVPLQAAMAGFIEEGHFARHLRRMRRVYEARHRSITRILARDFGDELAVIPSTAGLHVSAMARHASVERIQEVVRRAHSVGVDCFPLSMFAVGDRPQAGLTLGYGAIATDRIEGGLRRLRQSFDAVPAAASSVPKSGPSRTHRHDQYIVSLRDTGDTM